MKEETPMSERHHNRLWMELTVAGYNLVGLAKLTAATA